MKFISDLKKSIDSLKSSLPGYESERKHRIYAWIAAVLAAVLLYFALKGIDWNESLQTVKEGKYWLTPVLLLWASVSDILRALRWRILLQREKKIKFWPVFWANMIGYFGNMTLPARAGEALRSIYLGKNAGISSSFTFATCMVERVMDAIVLVLVGSIAILSLENVPILLINAIKIMACLGFFALVFMILLPFLKGSAGKLIQRIQIPPKNQAVVISFIENFSLGFSALHDSQRTVQFLGFTGIIWLSDTLWYLLAGYVFDIHLPLGLAFVLIASLGLSSAIPSTPGYIGVYQFAAVLVLTPYGFSRGEVVAYITAVQFLSILQVTFWGVMGILRFPKIQVENNSQIDGY